ncbi:hypothetical protein ACHQM5_022505 [Ranunculus cassubicifolius]
MSGGVQEQWNPKVTISANPSQSKTSWAKGRTPGWAALDRKQRGKMGAETEPDIDLYSPSQNTITPMPHPQSSVIGNGKPLKSFSSAVQHSAESSYLAGHGSYPLAHTVIGESSTKFGNKDDNKKEMHPSIEKLRNIHSWAASDLIEDVLGAVNDDIDQAMTLLKSMVPPEFSKETKETENVVEDDMEDIAKLISALENDNLDAKMDTTHHNEQLNLRRLISAPVEPEWEEDDVYLSRRKDAIRATRSASQHSRAASNAFMRGDHISARELSSKAQEEWMAAEKLNARAAEEILSIRNNGNNVWKLDLHGLHASEAVRALQNHLWKIESQVRLNRSVSPNSIIKPVQEVGSWQRPSVLQVVTGTGNHSRGQASLPMAVRSFLFENGYRFDEPRSGVIDVRPKFRHR